MINDREVSDHDKEYIEAMSLPNDVKAMNAFVYHQLSQFYYARTAVKCIETQGAYTDFLRKCSSHAYGCGEYEIAQKIRAKLVKLPRVRSIFTVPSKEINSGRNRNSE